MLMLEVVSVHKASMGANVRRCIAESEQGEFTIGRLESCHWVLPQDYVSRLQAVIRCVNGMYFLERKGSAPLAVNDRARPLDRNRIVRLSAGDRILIDDIEILVSEVESAQVPPAADLSAGAPPESLSAADTLGIGAGSDGGDVMELLGGGESGRESREAEGRTGPRREEALFPEGHSALDRLMDFSSSAEASRSSPGQAGSSEERWWEEGAAKPAIPGPRSGRAVPRPGERASPAAPESAVPTPARAPAARASAAGEVALDDVLRGAGLDPAQVTMSREVASQLGEVLRIVVAGTMDVLKGRNDIRRELRIPSTVLAPRENNPLKFSADVDDALHKLLVQRASAYLGAVAAFREAFGDIRHHQVALLKSVGIAFDYMLSRFDPKFLEQHLQAKAGRSGVLGLGAKGKPWQAYLEYFAELQADRDHAYRKLFGEEWARAYERELELQKAQHGAGKAQT